MRPATAWRFCVLAGVVVFVISWSFGKIPGLVACGPVPGGLGPIIGFELTRTPDEVAALFGSGDCRATLIAAQMKGLLLDGIGFIPGYTAFLMLAATAASRGGIRIAIVAMLLVAGISDEVEGFVMASIMKSLPGSPAQLDQLYWAVHIKFALLAIGTAMIGLALVRTARLVPTLAGLVVAVGGGAAIYGFVRLPEPTMMAAFTYAWVTLLVTAIVAAFAPGLFQGRGTT